jgi:hypothetical protein
VKPFRKGRTQRRDPPASGAVAAAAARAAGEARHAARLGALFPEFAYAYEERAKQRKRERTAATRAAAAHRGGGAPLAAAQQAHGADDEDDDDDFGGGGDYGGGGFSDDDGDAAPLSAEALEAAAAMGAALPSWDAAPAPAHAAADGEEPSYEDLVRAHIDRYAGRGGGVCLQRSCLMSIRLTARLLSCLARPSQLPGCCRRCGRPDGAGNARGKLEVQN